MTRLKTEWISDIDKNINVLDSKIKKESNLTLKDIAMIISNLDNEKFDEVCSSKKIGIVPITQGKGLIGDFADSIKAILAYIGLDAMVSNYTDVAGIYDCIKNGCNILFMADDERYIAFDMEKGSYGENDISTAMGYILILEEMMKKYGREKDEPLLLIGIGRVGSIALDILNKKSKNVIIFDKEISKIDTRCCDTISSVKEIKNYRNILDFTNEGSWISEDLLSKDSLISTPGVPFSLTASACSKIGNHVINDLLEIGTVSMLGMCLR